MHKSIIKCVYFHSFLICGEIIWASSSRKENKKKIIGALSTFSSRNHHKNYWQTYLKTGKIIFTRLNRTGTEIRSWIFWPITKENKFFLINIFLNCNNTASTIKSRENIITKSWKEKLLMDWNCTSKNQSKEKKKWSLSLRKDKPKNISIGSQLSTAYNHKR